MEIPLKFGNDLLIRMENERFEFGFNPGVESLIPFSNVNSQFVPVGRMNTNASVGLNILFGFRE